MHLPHSFSCFLFFFGVGFRFNPEARRRNRHFPWWRNTNSVPTTLILCTQSQDVTDVVTHKILYKLISFIIILSFPNSVFKAVSLFSNSKVYNSDQPGGLVDRISYYWSWCSGFNSPFLPWGCFLEGEGSDGDHGLESLVELRFKAPPGTSYPYITIHLNGTT
jgi:hypothetical protein